MSKVYAYKSMFTTKAQLEASCGVNSDDLAKLKVESHPQNGVDLMAVIAALNEKWRISRKIAGSTDDADAQTIAMELQQEKLMKERIHNQTRLGALISKVEAQNRMLRLLGKSRELLQTAIREVAHDRVSENPTVIKPTQRAWVEYLSSSYNDCFDQFEKNEANVREWADDGSTKILKTRLIQAQSDKDIDDIILNQGIVQ